LSDYVITAVKF